MDIPGFKLGREFADGEYCRVYNALDLSNHKTVNIQVFDSSLITNQAFSRQFRNVTSKLVGTSFGIMAPFLQAEISNQACYVVSQYFPNSQQLSATPPTLTRRQILKFALQLAKTLDQLHLAGLVHGGIEYNSLYFKAPDQLMLKPVILQRLILTLRPITFKSLEQAQKRYLAPEASKGLTPATDFYALGVLLYQLIFGSLPVDKTDARLFQEWPSTGGIKDLKVFFIKLLAHEPGQRIQSHNQFTEALEQCGIDLLKLAPSVSKTSAVQYDRANHDKTASRPFSKWMVLTASLAVIALAGTLILLPSHEEAQKPVLEEAQQQPVLEEAQQQSALDEEAQQQRELEDASEVVASAETTNVEKKPVEQPSVDTFTKIEMTEAEVSPSVENLYQQALTQMETNPEAALQIVNDLLEQKPADIASLKLKQQIEKELDIRSLINTAEQQLKELKLLDPSGDNAYESYQTLAGMLSSDDERVRSGFNHIAATYHTLAENLFKEEHLDKALERVERGLSVKDDYAPLLKLRITINEKKNELQRKLKLAKLEKQRELEIQKILEKQQRREEQRLRIKKEQAALEQKRQKEEKAKRLAQQVKEKELELIKQSKVDALLTSANDHLKAGRRTLKKVFAAHINYDELQKLNSKSQRVTELKEALINAYMLLSERQSNDKLYKLAIQAIEQGVQMSPEDKKQLQIRSQLSFSTF